VATLLHVLQHGIDIDHVRAPALAGQNPGSGSPSALPPLASPASAAPTSRPWVLTLSRWPPVHRDSS
jgi:hypothetical protein